MAGRQSESKFAIILYNLNTGKMSNKEIVKFHRELYGYTDHSQNGKYTYRRPGFLDNILHLNPCKSALIVKKEDSQKIADFIKQVTENVFVREIVLEEGDWIEKL